MNSDDMRKKIESEPFCSINKIVYEYLYQGIIDLSLCPGTKLNELQLSIDIGISRSPIKMAIDRLCKEGLVEKVTGKFTVAALDQHDCIHLSEMRKAVEGEAAYLAAIRIVNEDIDNIKDLLCRAEKGTTTESRVEFDCQFHQMIINISRNQYIIDSYNRFSSKVKRYRHFSFYSYNSTLTDRSLRCHYSILRAIENGFSSLAREEMIEDISLMQMNIYKCL